MRGRVRVAAGVRVRVRVGAGVRVRVGAGVRVRVGAGVRVRRVLVPESQLQLRSRLEGEYGGGAWLGLG